MSAGDTLYTYDLRGNRTSDGQRTFEWDALNRLVAVDGVRYGYDVDDQRVTRRDGSATEHYLHDRQSVSGLPQIIESHGDDGETLGEWR